MPRPNPGTNSQSFSPDHPAILLAAEQDFPPFFEAEAQVREAMGYPPFSRLAGVILGAVEAPARKRFPPDRTLAEVLLENFLPLGVPVVVDLPVGHRNGKWTVPIGAGFGKVFRLGKLPLNANFQGFYNASRPKSVGPWSMRFQLQLLFPK